MRPPSRPTGVSWTWRSSPAPTPWKRRSWTVGMSLRCLPRNPRGPEVGEGVPQAARAGCESRSLTPMATCRSRSRQTAASRSSIGPGTSTLLAHRRSHSSSNAVVPRVRRPRPTTPTGTARRSTPGARRAGRPHRRPRGGGARPSRSCPPRPGSPAWPGSRQPEPCRTTSSHGLPSCWWTSADPTSPVEEPRGEGVRPGEREEVAAGQDAGFDAEPLAGQALLEGQGERAGRRGR